MNAFKLPRRRLVSERQVGLFSGILSGALYGGMVFLIHAASGRVPASEITFVRATCAVICLLPFVLRHGTQWVGRQSVLLWIRSLVGALSVLCLAWNLQHTSVGFANTLFNLAPMLVVILGILARQESFHIGRFVNIVLVVVASAIFWYGSRASVSLSVWAVGLGGMCAAAIAYAILKSLPSLWNPLDITWCLNLATMPVALLFKHGPWVTPSYSIGILMALICALSLVADALRNLSFKFLELSTATALVPSTIIWGVVLDMGSHTFPPVQGVIGCLLYLGATIGLAVKPRKGTEEYVETGQRPSNSNQSQHS